MHKLRMYKGDVASYTGNTLVFLYYAMSTIGKKGRVLGRCRINV